MWVTYRCAQGIAVVGVRVCDCSVCLCLPKQRRLVRDIYRPSATALATVGSRPRGRFLGQLYLEEAAGVPVPGLSLMWCLVTCWRFFLRFSSKKKKTQTTQPSSSAEKKNYPNSGSGTTATRPRGEQQPTPKKPPGAAKKTNKTKEKQGL